MSRCRPSPGLHASPAFSIWIVNGYQLAITISLLPLASLGEIIGYRRVYLAGLLLFTVASLFCALSHTLLLLTVARILQGFGAAGIMSVNAALVRFTYPRAQLGHGIGINALVVAVSAAVGPTVAAGILAVGTWPWLFAINIPFGIVTLALGWRFLPHTAPAVHSFDWQGAVLSAVTFGLGIAAIDSVGHGETLLLCCREFGIAAGAGVLLVIRQTHHALAAAAGGPVAHSHLRAVDLDLDRLVLRPDAGLCRDAFLSREPFRLFGRPDRASDHALADRGGVHRAARRAPGRTLSGGIAGRRWLRAVRGRPRRAGAAAGPPQPSTWSGAWRWPARASACSSRPTTAP